MIEEAGYEDLFDFLDHIDEVVKINKKQDQVQDY